MSSCTRGTDDFAINVESTVIWSDIDSDGISDRKDLDSDSDGISDLQESGADVSVLDTDSDGIINGAAFVDGDSDGLADAIETAHGADTGTPAVNSDSDGIADYRIERLQLTQCIYSPETHVNQISVYGLSL